MEMDLNRRWGWIKPEIERYNTLSALCWQNRKAQEVALENCREDFLTWVQDWAFTYDPRLVNTPLPATFPWRPFDFQLEYMKWLYSIYRERGIGLTEKSRDMGATWCHCALYFWAWLFEDGFSGGVGSMGQAEVDRKGDPDSIFQKFRILLDYTPEWMVPEGFDRHEHDNHMRLIHPDRQGRAKNTIKGEVGGNMGRSGRSTVYWVDEHAFVEHAEEAERAIAQNSDCRLYLSTPNGTGNEFHQKRNNPNIDVYTLHWSKHPWKTQDWYEQKKMTMSQVSVAQELDIDYTASVEGILIPGKYVEAAIEIDLERKGRKLAGLDVADSGAAENVYTQTHGPCVVEVDAWAGDNTTDTAWKAARMAREAGVSELRYDAIGVGAGVGGTLNSAEEDLPFEWHAVYWGDNPTATEYPDEQRPADERFLNKRAEDWWNMMLRLKHSWERINGKRDWPDEHCLSIPRNSDLQNDLSKPKIQTTSTGKIKLESKKSMTSRGLDSPDYADSLAIAISNIDKPVEVEIY